MNLKSVNTCINCQSLSDDFHCVKHETQVDLYYVCDSHISQISLNKDSSCVNCKSYKSADCPHPKRAGDGMLCFSWKTNSVLN